MMQLGGVVLGRVIIVVVLLETIIVFARRPDLDAFTRSLTDGLLSLLVPFFLIL